MFELPLCILADVHSICYTPVLQILYSVVRKPFSVGKYEIAIQYNTPVEFSKSYRNMQNPDRGFVPILLI